MTNVMLYHNVFIVRWFCASTAVLDRVGFAIRCLSHIQSRRAIRCLVDPADTLDCSDSDGRPRVSIVVAGRVIISAPFCLEAIPFTWRSISFIEEF